MKGRNDRKGRQTKRRAPTRRKRAPDRFRRGLRAVEAGPAPRSDAGEIEPDASFPIVGIGASAGGIEALRAVLDPIPPSVDMAFVVVQHLSPHQESLLPGVLSASTRLSVAHAEETTKLEVGHVYVVPPNRFIELTDGHLELTKRPGDRSQFTPIDHFFSSLARFGQTRAIGVVLSGSASDGALGLRDIKAAGGITMAQDPSTARFDGMPRAAIEAGVDMVRAPAQLAEELVRIAGHPLVRRVEGPRLKRRVAEDSQEHLGTIFKILKKRGGVDFSNYRAPTVLRRLHRQMVLRRVSTLRDYVDLLEKDPAEAVSLTQSILIHVTRFFRDPETFDALAKLSSRLAANRGTAEPVRIWVPGCATGEEAYSIAITLVEMFGSDSDAARVQLFGTDVSGDAIDRARRGIYPRAIESDVSPERLVRFFTRLEDSFRISQQIRELCIFARQDVTQDPPFSRLDLIVCRNLFIYLDLTLQRRILNVFYYALKPTGLLMLGSAESTGAEADLFEPVDHKHRVFAKRPGKPVRHAGFAQNTFSPREFQSDAAENRADLDVQVGAERILLEKHTPPSVVLGDDLRIRRVRGKVGAYLAPGPGNASLSIFKMARQGLAAGLREALERARRSLKPVRKEGLKVRTNAHVEEVTIEVVPIRTKGGDQYFLVLFEPARPRGSEARGSRRPISTTKRVRELEDDLEGTRSEMQSVIQELEASNEELQSANEEVLSSNEELQSTNEELDTAREELQSTNEEIITVNEELHARNEELAHANSDLVNLLTNVQIAIVMLDRDLRILHFTPLAEKILNVLPSDIGRPISHLNPNIDCPKLVTMITEALKAGKAQEQTTQALDGRWYSLKVRPYANIQGAVVVLFDVDNLKREQEESAVMLAILDATCEALVVIDRELRISYATKALADLLQLEPADLEGVSLFEVPRLRWDPSTLRPALLGILAGGASLEDHAVIQDLPDRDPRALALTARRLEFHDERAPMVVISLRPRSSPA